MPSEAIIQQQTRLLLAQYGAQAWRNNSGAFTDDTGRVVRYGLGNDSAQLNAAIKSSDLIGLIPTVIHPHHVGRTLGIFAAFECKPSNWHMTPSDKRAIAQEKFLSIVREAGGFGGFVTNPHDIFRIIQS